MIPLIPLPRLPSRSLLYGRFLEGCRLQGQTIGDSVFARWYHPGRTAVDRPMARPRAAVSATRQGVAAKPIRRLVPSSAQHPMTMPVAPLASCRHCLALTAHFGNLVLWGWPRQGRHDRILQDLVCRARSCCVLCPVGLTWRRIRSSGREPACLLHCFIQATGIESYR